MLGSLGEWWRRLAARLRPDVGSGAAGREVVLGVFSLDGAVPEACRKLGEGDEVELANVDQPEGGLGVFRRGVRLGLLPAGESARLVALLARGTRLGCRVVRLGPKGGDQAPRVRVSVLM